METILVVGLGNPGRKYQNTRHNIGFRVIDTLAKELRLNFKNVSNGTNYSISDAVIIGKKVIFLKPLDYMNRSGNAVSRVANYFKVPIENILVIHDDLDVPFGRIKIVRSGGHGGHNGIRSIIEGLGSKDFPRIKLGIGRPPDNIPADRYVLSRFSKGEEERVKKICKKAKEAVIVYIEKGIDMAMNQFNGITIE